MKSILVIHTVSFFIINIGIYLSIRYWYRRGVEYGYEKGLNNNE